MNIKYIDPSYMVRSVPANAHDAIYCIQLAQNAVHAGMAGKTGMIMGSGTASSPTCPLALAASPTASGFPRRTRCGSPCWRATGQPVSRLTNELKPDWRQWQ